jgi:hypothetical protein
LFRHAIKLPVRQVTRSFIYFKNAETVFESTANEKIINDRVIYAQIRVLYHPLYDNILQEAILHMGDTWCMSYLESITG